MLEIKRYDDWSEESDITDEAEKIRAYTDYVRKGYFRNGELNDDTEQEIINGVAIRAQKSGLVPEDADEEGFNNLVLDLARPKQNAENDLQLLHEHYTSDFDSSAVAEKERASLIQQYLVASKTNPETAAGLRESVNEILADKNAVRSARIAAVDRGDLRLAAIEEDGGRYLYTGPNVKPETISGELDGLLASGAINSQDLLTVSKYLKSDNGGLTTVAENNRGKMVQTYINDRLKSDANLARSFDDAAEKFRRGLEVSQMSTGERIWDGTKQVAMAPFIVAAEVLGIGDRQMPTADPISMLSTDAELNKRFTQEEIERGARDYIANRSGLSYRSDQPESGIAVDSYGNPIIAAALLPNKAKFDAALAAAPLSEDQKLKAQVIRDAQLETSAPQFKNLILSEDGDAASAYAKAKANGKSDAAFVQEWVSNNEGNYSGMSERAQQLLSSTGYALAGLPVGILSLMGSETATKAMVAMMKDQSDREQYSNLMGDKFGLGFQITNAVPQVATDVLASIGTGSGYLALKTAMTGGVKATLRNATKIALSQVDEAAGASVRAATAAGGEAATSAAFKEVGQKVAVQLTKTEQLIPVAATSFVRSAGATYGSIYGQLPEDMSHEDKHRNAIGYALAAGLSTAAITTGMSALGLGGVENVVTRRFRPATALDDVAAGERFVPLDKLSYKQAKFIYEGVRNEGQAVSDKAFQAAMRKAIGGAWKNLARRTAGGGLSEKFEETLDQAVQIKLEDAALDQNTPLSEKVNQLWHAAVIGGALGGVSAAATQTFETLNLADMSVAMDARNSVLGRVANELTRTGNPATAEVVQRRMNEANAAVRERARLAEAAKATAAEAKPDLEAPANDTVVPEVAAPVEPTVDETGQMKFDFAEEKTFAPQRVYLTDLVGETVTAFGHTGVLEETNDGRVRLRFNKALPTGETGMVLGQKFADATKLVSKTPTLNVLGEEANGVPAGTPYVNRGKARYALPDAATNPASVIRSPKTGEVSHIILNDAQSLDSEARMDVHITSPYQIRAVARYYGIDISPIPVTEEDIRLNEQRRAFENRRAELQWVIDFEGLEQEAKAEKEDQARLIVSDFFDQSETVGNLLTGSLESEEFQNAALSSSPEDLQLLSDAADALDIWAARQTDLTPEVKQVVTYKADQLRVRANKVFELKLDLLRNTTALSTSQQKRTQPDLFGDEFAATEEERAAARAETATVFGEQPDFLAGLTGTATPTPTPTPEAPAPAKGKKGKAAVAEPDEEVQDDGDAVLTAEEARRAKQFKLYNELLAVREYPSVRIEGAAAITGEQAEARRAALQEQLANTPARNKKARAKIENELASVEQQYPSSGLITLRSAEIYRKNLETYRDIASTDEGIATVTARIAELDQNVRLAKRAMSQRSSRIRQQLKALASPVEDAETVEGEEAVLTESEQYLADALRVIEATQPAKPTAPPQPPKAVKPKRIVHETAPEKDWSSGPKIRKFRYAEEKAAFDGLVEAGLIVTNLPAYGFQIGGTEGGVTTVKTMEGEEPAPLFHKKRYLGDPTDPNSYITGKHKYLFQRVKKLYPFIQPETGSDPVYSDEVVVWDENVKRGKAPLPVNRDSEGNVVSGAFTNNPILTLQQLNKNIEVFVPRDILILHNANIAANRRSEINPSIGVDPVSGRVLYVLDPISLQPRYIRGETSTIDKGEFSTRQSERSAQFLVSLADPSPYQMLFAGPTAANRQSMRPSSTGLEMRDYVSDFDRYFDQRARFILTDRYGLSNDSIDDIATESRIIYLTGLYEFAMASSLRDYVTKAFFFGGEKGGLSPQIQKIAKREGMTVDQIKERPELFRELAAGIKPDALTDLNIVSQMRKYFKTNDLGDIAKVIQLRNPSFSGSPEQIIRNYGAHLFKQINDPKSGVYYVGPQSASKIINKLGNLYQQREIRVGKRREQTGFDIGGDPLRRLDELASTGRFGGEAVAPEFVAGYDETMFDSPEAKAEFGVDLRSSLIASLEAEPELERTLQSIAAAFDPQLGERTGELLVDALGNLFNNSVRYVRGNKILPIGVVNRLAAGNYRAGLKAAGIMLEMGWLPPVADQTIAPPTEAQPVSISPTASNEQLRQIIADAKARTREQVTGSTVEQEQEYRRLMEQAVREALPDIVKAQRAAEGYERAAELRQRYADSFAPLTDLFEKGADVKAEAVNRLTELVTGNRAEATTAASQIERLNAELAAQQEGLQSLADNRNQVLQAFELGQSKRMTAKNRSALESLTARLADLDSAIPAAASNVRFTERQIRLAERQVDVATRVADRFQEFLTSVEQLTGEQIAGRIRAVRATQENKAAAGKQRAVALRKEARDIATAQMRGERTTETPTTDVNEYSQYLIAKREAAQQEAAQAAMSSAAPELSEYAKQLAQKREFERSMARFALREKENQSSLYRSASFAFTPELQDAARESNLKAMEFLGLVNNDPETVVSALRILAAGQNEQQRELAKLLLLVPDFVRSVRFAAVDATNADWAGLYDSTSNTVLVNLTGHNGRGLADVLLHEYLHAATVSFLNNPITAQQRAAVARIGRLRNLAVKQAEKMGLSDSQMFRLATSNDAEFLTYTLTAPEFQSLLKALTPRNESSLLRRFVDAVLEMFGVKSVRLSKAVNELFDFTEMSLAHFHTYNISTVRDMHEIAQRGAVIQEQEIQRILLRQQAQRLGKGEGIYEAAAIRTQQDADYLAAVERGDSGSDNLNQLLRDAPQAERREVVDAWMNRNPVAAYQLLRMVAEAARAAGYTTKAYHGSSELNLTRFDPTKIKSQEAGVGFFFTTIKEMAQHYADKSGGRLYQVFLRQSNPLITDVEYPSSPANDKAVFEATLEGIARNAKLSAPERAAMLSSFEQTTQGGTPNLLSNIFYFQDHLRKFMESPSFSSLNNQSQAGIRTIYNALRGEFGRETTLNTIWLLTGKDGMVFDNSGVLTVLRSSQIKSADPVTFDENGNVILLSQRFDPTSESILRTRIAVGPNESAIDVAAELPKIVPAGVELQADPKSIGEMEVRSRTPNTIFYNPNTVNRLVSGLSARNARSVLRTSVDEEVAHIAGDRVFGLAGYDEVAAELGPEGLARVADTYYSNLYPDPDERAVQVAADRESGMLDDRTIAAEWVRMRITEIATGRTREPEIDFLYTNPNLMERFLGALKAFVNMLKERLAVSFTTGTAARYSMAAREFRRIRNGGILPAPEPAPTDELGDSVLFMRAVSNEVVEGQEDRTVYELPISEQPQTDKRKSLVDRFWDNFGIKAKLYNLPSMYREMLRNRDGDLEETQFTMMKFYQAFPKLRDEALAAGVPIEDITTVLGTSKPMISKEASKRIAAEVRAQKGGPTLERKLLKQEAERFRAEFRVQQEATEQRLQDAGFGELVDLMVETREETNKYKVRLNMGETNDVYLTRPYRFFQSEAWQEAVKSGTVFEDEDGTRIDFGALREIAGRKMFEDEVRKTVAEGDEAMTEEQIGQLIQKRLDEYLFLGTEGKPSLVQRMEESKNYGGVLSVRKDINLYKPKMDIDENLRELLGEVTDPLELATRTLYSVGRLSANKYLLDNLEKSLVNAGLASKDKQAGYLPVFDLNGKTAAPVSPLDQLYVREDIAKALKEELGPRNINVEAAATDFVGKIGKMTAAASGYTTFAKTSLSVGYWPRNVAGGIALTLAQGVPPLTGSSLEAIRLAWLGSMDKASTTEEQRDVIRRLVDLQVLRDETRGRIAMDLLKGFTAGKEEQLDDTLKMILEAQLSGQTEGLMKKLKVPLDKMVDFTAQLNNFVDSMFKVNMYFYELNNLKKAYPDEKENVLEAKAAHKVKLTLPTHSQQFDLTKAYQKSPYQMLFVPFIRWKTEVLRTMLNTPLLAIDEIKSGNAVEMRRGIQRLIGFSSTLTLGAAAGSGMYSALFGLLAMAGGDEEKEDKNNRPLTATEVAALKIGLPKWQRDHNVAARLVNGKLQVTDMTNILPYSQVTDIFNIIQEGIASGKGVQAGAIGGYIAQEWFGANIAAKTTAQGLMNRNDFGQKIVLDDEDPLAKVGKMALFILQGTVEPSAVRKGRQVFRSGEADRMEMILGELTGARPQVYEYTEVLRSGMFELKRGQDDAVALLRPIKSGRKLDVAEVPDILGRHQNALNRNQERLANFLTAMQRLGAKTPDVLRTAKAAGYSQDSIQSALRGYRIEWRPNDEFFRKMQDDIVRLEEDDFSLRRQAIVDYKRERPRLNQLSIYVGD